jgi:RimJ/RimL family protein N-acetyltransferase
MTVYILWHTHVLSEDRDDSKLIGVYASEEAAKQAQVRVGGQPGFQQHPEGFEVVGYELGKDHWEEGYATMLGDKEVEG